jgi:hypothetical protein
MRNKKRYGLGHFLLDCILIVITGGLWGLYLLLRALARP